VKRYSVRQWKGFASEEEDIHPFPKSRAEALRLVRMHPPCAEALADALTAFNSEAQRVTSRQPKADRLTKDVEFASHVLEKVCDARGRPPFK